METRRTFKDRHIGPRREDVSVMLNYLGYGDMDGFIKSVVPRAILNHEPLALGSALSESSALDLLRSYASKNKKMKSFIGMGYFGTIVPPVIQRNVLENPGWYTQYTPYQAEIAQGRLEALLNFQTMVTELTGLDVANASLLDEGTAAAEAMALSFFSRKNENAKVFFVSSSCHPQTISVIKTRAWSLGIEVIIGDHRKFKAEENIFGLILQYPASDGLIEDHSDIITSAKSCGIFVTIAADILALCLLKSPGQMGADIAVGSTQRFGVPMGYGGPHAAYFATRDGFKRKIPGRIIGVSLDKEGRRAMRMALQTREQHIRREKATSNICTSQVLLAVMSSMYAVYHGADGLVAIAQEVHIKALRLASSLQNIGVKLVHKDFFDTLRIEPPSNFKRINAEEAGFNLRYFEDGTIGLSVDEATTDEDLNGVARVLGCQQLAEKFPQETAIFLKLQRTGPFLQQSVFKSHHSETEMLRYIRKLESKDLSLTTSMIPLGSCTMKLNATAELLPVSWPEFSELHPFTPVEQALGYQQLFKDLEADLCTITGFDAASLQPNSGAQGEYAGLLVIKKYLESKNEFKRDLCLIPASAHGTNPASAVMAGMRVVVVACNKTGNVDMEDLKLKIRENESSLACLMITYPSTHGVFEEGIKELCDLVHNAGAQVYMDGANLNAQVGLCKPGLFGPDVCHINLHKTFCIPHGGGGPGMGPICVKAHLANFLPNHDVVKTGGAKGCGSVSAAPWGSAGILPISWMYIRMMGSVGLKLATQTAILNANYLAKKLDPYFSVVYKGTQGLVAHECIVDLREFKASCGIEVEDVAKRLMDYGFHAPTVSFPIAGTLMIEPTESESLKEMDRFCDAMIAIRKEIGKIESGVWPKNDNPLKNAPHTATMVTADEWNHVYSRQEAAYPSDWVKERKFWPTVARIDGAYGDRNLVCTCEPLS